jgi:hypothetical protein
MFLFEQNVKSSNLSFIRLVLLIKVLIFKQQPSICQVGYFQDYPQRNIVTKSKKEFHFNKFRKSYSV